MNISYYQNIKQSKEKDIDFLDFCNDVKNGTYKIQIETLRASTGAEKTKLKNSLPAVTLSGTFNEKHKATALLQHSGLMQIDIDNTENLNELKSRLYADKYTFCGFISPSGNGLKLVVKISPEPDRHKAHFLALEKYYKNLYNVEIDKACKDVSRLCFVSYDTELFLNENAILFSDTHTTYNKVVAAQGGAGGNDFYYNVSNFDEFVSEIERQRINIAESYDEWLKVGFAIANEFNAPGFNFFDRISQISSKYNYESVRKQYDECLRTNNGHIEIKTVFSMAKNAGLTIPKRQSAPTPAPSAATATKNADSGTGASDTFVVNNKEYEYYKNKDINEIMECEIPQSIDIENDIQTFGFYSLYNTFHSRIHAGKGTKDIVISNFIFSILFQFDDGTQDTRRLIKYKNAHTGDTGIIELNDSQLCSIDKFTAAFSSKNCLFNGTKRDVIGILQKQYLYQQKADYINILGYNKSFNFYAFSNAIITSTGNVKEVNDIGLVKDGDKLFYLPHWAGSNRDNAAYNEERNIFFNKNSNITVAEFFSLMFKAYRLKGIISSIFLINSILYDLIFNVTKFFPYLFLFGEAGTAKTSLTNLILGAFGKDITGVSVNGSTFKGTARKFSQYQNSIIYLKEFDKNNNPEYDSLLKTVYDGSSYTIAQKSNDNKTQTFDVKSGIIIDGNILPVSQEAVYDRIILIELRKTKFTDEQTAAFEKIKSIYESTGLTNITLQINLLRPVFEEEYKDTFLKLVGQIKNNTLLDDYETNTLKDRTQRHISFLLATAYLLIKNNVISNVDFKFNDIAEQLIKDSIEKETTLHELKETTVFWQAFAYDRTKEEMQRNIQNKNSFILSNIESKIYINYDVFYMNYSKYCQMRKKNPTDSTTMKKLLTSEEYKPFFPNRSEKKRTSFRKKGFWLHCFNLTHIKDFVYKIDEIDIEIISTPEE